MKLISKTKLGIIALAAFGVTTLAAGSADAKTYKPHEVRPHGIENYRALKHRQVKQIKRDFKNLDTNKDGVLTHSDGITKTKVGYKWKRVRRGWKRVPVYRSKYSNTVRGVINISDYNWDRKVTFREYKRVRIIGWHARLSGINPAHVKVPKAPVPTYTYKKPVWKPRFVKRSPRKKYQYRYGFRFNVSL